MIDSVNGRMFAKGFSSLTSTIGLNPNNSNILLTELKTVSCLGLT